MTLQSWRTSPRGRSSPWMMRRRLHSESFFVVWHVWHVQRLQLDAAGHKRKTSKTLEYFTCQVSQIGLPGRSGRRGGSLCPQILSAQTASRRKEPFSGDDIFCFCMCMYIYSSNFSKNQQLAVVTFLVLCKPQYFTIREPYFPIFYSAKC